MDNLYYMLGSNCNRYILRRWRKDVVRLYKNAKINYDGLQSTPEQLRYEDLCRDFSNVASMAAEEEESYRKMKEWIAAQPSHVIVSRVKPSCGSNLLPSRNSANIDSNCTEEDKQKSVSRVLDPKSSKRKGAPPKNRKPRALEKKAKRSKPCSKPTEQKATAPITNPVGQVFIQPPTEMQQYPFFNPGYFSHQLMWGPTGPMNLVPIFSPDQHNIGPLNFVPNYSTDQHNHGTSGTQGDVDK